MLLPGFIVTVFTSKPLKAFPTLLQNTCQIRPAIVPNIQKAALQSSLKQSPTRLFIGLGAHTYSINQPLPASWTLRDIQITWRSDLKILYLRLVIVGFGLWVRDLRLLEAKHGFYQKSVPPEVPFLDVDWKNLAGMIRIKVFQRIKV